MPRQNDAESSAPAVLSLPASEAPRRRKGGPEFHKQPCRCRPCVSRLRQAEALAGPAGGSRPPAPPTSTVLEADLHEVEYDKLGRRKRNDRERSAKARVAEWIKWRAVEPTMTTAEIATKIGISPRAMYGYISRATKEGWLKFDDPMSRVEHELMPLIADNVKDFLEAKDRTVTIEAAKGVLFPMYRESKGVSEAPKTVLALKLEMPDGQTKIAGGVIMGSPKTIPIDVTLLDDDA